MKAYIWQYVSVLALVVVLIVVSVIVPSVEAPWAIHTDIQPEETITLAFVGDVMLGRNVELLMNMKGHEYPFAFTKELFNKADFVVANLEGPIPHDHVRTLSGEMSFSFASYIPELLNQYGIHAVSLANNHTFDKGAKVYVQTVESLQNAHISSFGHPTSQNVSYAQNYIVNDVPFTLLGFNATFPTFDLVEAVQTVEEAKIMFPEGMLLVYMHWGDEYKLVSNDIQQHIATSLHNAGADIIIGAHPHVTQEIRCESLDRCTVYSLGNFIFDQYFSKDVEQGLVAYITFSRNAIQEIELVPVDGNHSQPRKMPESKDFLDNFVNRSKLEGLRLSTSTHSIILKPL